MAMPAARTVHTLSRDARGDVWADVSTDEGARSRVLLHTLPLVDMRRAAIVAGLTPRDVPGGHTTWNTIPKDDLRDAVLARVGAAPAPEPASATLSPSPNGGRMLTLEPEPATAAGSLFDAGPAVTPAPRKSTPAAGELAEVLARLMAETAANRGADEATVLRIVGQAMMDHERGHVTADDVRRLVDEHAATFAPRIVQTVVHLPARPEPIILEGKQHAVFERVLRKVQRGAHVFLAGPAGSGKTTLGRNVARALGRQFGAISCGPTTPDSRFWGYMDGGGRYVRTPLRDAVEHGHVYLVDEVDAGHAGILVTLNMLLSSEPGDVIPFPDGMVTVHPDFVIMAGANTWGTGATAQYVGRNALDAAFLNRFDRIAMDYDTDLERALALAAWPENPATAERWHARILALRTAAERVGVRVVISPRDTVAVIRSHRDGDTVAECEGARYLAGLDADAQRRLLDAAGVKAGAL